MKTILKVNFRRIIALLVVTILLLSSIHLGISSLAENPTEPLILNNCSGDTNNKINSKSDFTHAVVTDASDDGHAVKYTLKDGAIGDGSAKTTGFTFKANTSGLTNPENIKAFSVSVEFPASKLGTSRLTFRTKEPDTFRGTMYAIADDGTVTTSEDSALSANGFKGKLFLIINEETSVSVNYGKEYATMADYYEKNTFNNFVLWMQNYRSDCPYIIIDNITAYFDTQSALDAIESAKNYVPKPAISYTGKTVFPNQEITLSAEQSNIDIHYTLDGSEPTIESPKYDTATPIAITENCTLKTVGYRNGNYSTVISQEYVIYNESNYKTAVLQDGSTKGSVYQATKQRVTANVSGISPDDNCVEVKLRAKYSSALYVQTKPAKLSTTNITAEEIKTVYFWMSNPKGNGSIQLLFGNRTSSAIYGFTPGNYYLVDEITATYKKFGAGSDYIEIPDGFRGYVMFDTETSAGIDKIVADNFETLTMNYKLSNLNKDDVWYYDNITVSTKDAEFAAMQLAEECVAAPVVKTITSYVKSGDTVELFAEEGAEIYYTTDGTEPTITSNKYDADNPIVITADTTIKAFAIIDGVKSVIVSFDYLLIDPSLPNFTILNDGTIETGISNTISAAIALEDNISPNGSTYTVKGTKTSGGGILSFTLDDIDTDYMLVNDAFAFWVRVPANKTISLGAAFNSSTNAFSGKIITFDTDDGSIMTNEDPSKIELSGFEGYVILTFDDTATIGDYKWYEFFREKVLQTFVLSVQNPEFLDNTIAFDTLGFVADYNKLTAELNSAALRPDAPYTLFSSGMIVEGKNLLMYAGSNTDIFYTLDGTIPTMESTRYELVAMGGAEGDFSPIDIFSDLTVKMIAVRDGISSGVSTYSYTVDPKYTGPNEVILNNCSDEGLNTATYSSKFDYSVVNDATDDGNAFKFMLKEGAVEEGKSTNAAFRLKLNPDEVVSPMQIKALSIRLEIPASAQGKTSFFFRHAGDANSFRGKIFAIGDDGVVMQFENNASFKGFKGTLLFLISDVGVNYGSYALSMEEYVKNFGFAESNFTFYLQKYQSDCEYMIVDNLTAYYDADKALEMFNIEGLLADYSINTYENINMMVSNDCSGAKIYSGLNAFSDNITVEKSDVSKDDRNIALTFGNGEGFIEFANYCKDDMAVIADGMTFWVELPKGCGNTAVNLKINEAHQEMFGYGSKYHHYLIDVDGVISRVEGDIILPDGFRGWIIIPNSSTIVLEDTAEFVNGRIDYQKIISTSLIFKNENNSLSGKTLYIDDICWYTDFAKLVQSRAYCWAGQVFEN